MMMRSTGIMMPIAMIMTTIPVVIMMMVAAIINVKIGSIIISGIRIIVSRIIGIVSGVDRTSCQ